MIPKIQLLQALLFLENNLLLESELEEILNLGNLELLSLLHDLEMKLKKEESILEIYRINNKVGLKPKDEILLELKDIYKGLHKKRMSDASLETLGIIAFKQPLTKGEVEKIRGIDSSVIIKNLLKEELIKITGKKEVLGTPSLYGTTEKFLHYFGLKFLKELPNVDDFKEIYKNE